MLVEIPFRLAVLVANPACSCDISLSVRERHTSEFCVPPVCRSDTPTSDSLKKDCLHNYTTLYVKNQASCMGLCRVLVKFILTEIFLILAEISLLIESVDTNGMLGTTDSLPFQDFDNSSHDSICACHSPMAFSSSVNSSSHCWKLASVSYWATA